jgi:hypothetical protein
VLGDCGVAWCTDLTFLHFRFAFVLGGHLHASTFSPPIPMGQESLSGLRSRLSPYATGIESQYLNHRDHNLVTMLASSRSEFHRLPCHNPALFP